MLYANHQSVLPEAMVGSVVSCVGRKLQAVDVFTCLVMYFVQVG